MKRRVVEDFVEHWICPMPDNGVLFRVVEEEWTDDFTIRTIRKIELL